jgi:hypothetical protein
MHFVSFDIKYLNISLRLIVMSMLEQRRLSRYNVSYNNL